MRTRKPIRSSGGRRRSSSRRPPSARARACRGPRANNTRSRHRQHRARQPWDRLLVWMPTPIRRAIDQSLRRNGIYSRSEAFRLAASKLSLPPIFDKRNVR